MTMSNPRSIELSSPMRPFDRLQTRILLRSIIHRKVKLDRGWPITARIMGSLGTRRTCCAPAGSLLRGTPSAKGRTGCRKSRSLSHSAHESTHSVLKMLITFETMTLRSSTRGQLRKFKLTTCSRSAGLKTITSFLRQPGVYYDDGDSKIPTCGSIRVRPVAAARSLAARFVRSVALTSR